jgi:hypothetical protein
MRAGAADGPPRLRTLFFFARREWAAGPRSATVFRGKTLAS